MCGELVSELGREPTHFDSFVSAAHGGAGWRDGPSGNPVCKSLEEARLVPAASGTTCPSPSLRPASFPAGVAKP